jgi:hypothetical protein
MFDEENKPIAKPVHVPQQKNGEQQHLQFPSLSSHCSF